VVGYGMFQAFSLGTEENKKTANKNVKTTFIKTVISDVITHVKPQKFTVLSDL